MDVPVIGRKARDVRPRFHAFSSLWGLKPDRLLGERERFTTVSCFWTEQYDFDLAHIGHAEYFDTVDIEGNLHAHDCKITYLRGDCKLAVAVVHRDLEGLCAEVEFELTIDANVWTPAPGHEVDRALRQAKERTS